MSFPSRSCGPDSAVHGTLSRRSHYQRSGREICQRNGIKAMLNGTIASIGSQYVVTLEAVNHRPVRSLATGTGASDQQRRSAELAPQGRVATAPQAGRVVGVGGEVRQAAVGGDDIFAGCAKGALDWAMPSTAPARNWRRLPITSAPSSSIRISRWRTRAWERCTTTWVRRNCRSRIAQKAFELRDRASEHEKLYIMSHYYADSGPAG